MIKLNTLDLTMGGGGGGGGGVQIKVRRTLVYQKAAVGDQKIRLYIYPQPGPKLNIFVKQYSIICKSKEPRLT